jgi:hypothetical protein
MTDEKKKPIQNVPVINLETFACLRVNECEEVIRKIIPRIDDLSQLIACYIYCLNESEHQEWAKEYSMVYT